MRTKGPILEGDRKQIEAEIKMMEERIKRDTFYLEQNLTSRTAILIRDNKELTKQEAQKLITDYKKENDGYKDQNKLQLPQDVDKPAKSDGNTTEDGDN